ncbi:MAG TPA: Maf family protein, partial [Candidatus Synoicihabitans sp.]|nr:Maf family protein [Candidatus Synoicihabitans sp.]
MERATPRLILASASPRRRQLLAELGVPFEVVTADVIEHEDPTTDPREMVAHNAALKAEAVAVRCPDAYVLGADTTVFLNGA